MNRELLLTKHDIREIRPKCDVCGYELTFVEYLLLETRCVFHADDLTSVMKLSMLKYISLLKGDLELTRKKIEMKKRGLSEVDFMACVGVVGKDLHEIVTGQDMAKVMDIIKKHSGETV